MVFWTVEEAQIKVDSNFLFVFRHSGDTEVTSSS